MQFIDDFNFCQYFDRGPVRPGKAVLLFIRCCVVYPALLSIVLSLTSIPVHATEQRLSYEEGIAWYSLKTLSEITWPPSVRDNQHRIGLFTGQKSLIKAFRQLAERHHGAAIEIVEMPELTADPSLGSILVGTDKAIFYSKMKSLNPNALFFTTFKVRAEEQQIVLLQKGEQIEVSLNIPNLEAHGYGVSKALLQKAGSRTDLTQALTETETKLQQLVDKVAQKETRLAELNQELNAKNAALARDKKLLAEKEKELKNKERRLSAIRQQANAEQARFNEFQAQVERQSEALLNKRRQIQEATQKISQLQNQIEMTQRALRRQQSHLEQSQRELNLLMKTVDLQKWMLILIVAFAAVFVLMSWVLYRNNRLRRAANAELKKLNSKLFEMATTDSLTGLFNRRYFMEMANHEFSRWRRNQLPITFLMIDIDHFKKVNDQYGHLVGDRVIQNVAQLLSNSLREYDLLGRVGGEEFAMMLLDCDKERAFEIATRLCQQIAETEISAEEVCIRVTISIGVSALLPLDKNLLEAIGRADKALYEAKQTGRNRVVLFDAKGFSQKPSD